MKKNTVILHHHHPTPKDRAFGVCMHDRMIFDEDLS